MDPNRQCTCGYRRFRSQRTPTVTTVERWMLFDPGVYNGLGATGFGTYFGTGFEGAWGLFSATNYVTQEITACERCQRPRSSVRLGGITPLGSYVANGVYYVVAADVGRPVTCYELRLVAEDGTIYVVPLSLSSKVPLPVVADTPQTTEEEAPPEGAEVANTVLHAVLPEVVESGSYTAVLIDRCSGTQIPLATLELEAPPMILLPQHADLNGYPTLWLEQQFDDSSSQLASRSRAGLPFEYCEEVLEYDARYGTDPEDQGWTHNTGAGGSPNDFQLVEGGALRAGTPGAGDDSYWEKSVELAAGPSSVHAYAHYLVDTATVTPAAGEGLGFRAMIAASGGAYSGVRWEARATGHRVTALDAASDAAWTEGTHSPRGWHTAGFERASGLGQGVLNGFYDTDLSFGTIAGPAAADEMVVVFGDLAGEGLVAYVRNYVASTPGRFLRAGFTGYTQTTTPRIRLYLVSDLAPTSDRTARFLVRYGTGTSDPYAIPASEVSVTVSFGSKNTVYETAVDLTGLIANNPFWFTVERDWSHAEDTLQTTAWLLQATVRAS